MRASFPARNPPLKLKTQAVISSGTQVATLLHGINSNKRGQERVLINLPNLQPTKVLQKPSKFPADKSPPTTTEPARKKSIIIAGDSIVKHLQGRKMTKQHNVRVNSFPGATVEDMKDYVKPLLRRKCDKFIVHAGTNSLHIFEEREVAEQIVDLAQEISASHPDVQVVVSGLTTRTDKNNLKEKIPEVNKIL